MDHICLSFKVVPSMAFAFLMGILPATADSLRSAEGAYQAGNFPLAMDHYKEAAEAGDAEAQTRLALLLLGGLAGEEDSREALYWLRKAAAQNHTEAMFQIGLQQWGRNDVFLTASPGKEPAQWMEQAAARGHVQAQGWLGYFYENGYGGALQNLKRAEEWYRKAAASGNPEALYSLGKFYRYLRQDMAKAATAFERAAEAGHAPAQLEIAELYDKRRGVGHSLSNAYYWYERFLHNEASRSKDDTGAAVGAQFSIKKRMMVQDLEAAQRRFEEWQKNAGR